MPRSPITISYMPSEGFDHPPVARRVLSGITRNNSMFGHSVAVTVTSDSDDDSLMKSVLATSENNATKSIAARQERGRMQV